jgi:hypothetical protein
MTVFISKLATPMMKKLLFCLTVAGLALTLAGSIHAKGESRTGGSVSHGGKGGSSINSNVNSGSRFSGHLGGNGVGNVIGKSGVGASSGGNKGGSISSDYRGYGYGRGWCYWHPYACYRR